MHIGETPFSYEALETQFRGLMFQVREQAPRAAVVLLPDWRGQSALARQHARDIAAMNCAVVIGDLCGNGFTTEDPSAVGAMVKRLLEQRGRGVEALAACVAALRQQIPDVPVICLGYSAGAVAVLDYGRAGADVAGLITCSGLLKTAETGSATKIHAPVLILQGTQDVVSPLAIINALIMEMDEAGNNVRLELYTQTHHAFDNPEAGTDPSARLVYSAASARRAKRAIAEFIDEVATA